MIVGPDRFRIARLDASGPGDSNQGVVVQAVLVMVLVTTIGVLLIAARLAGFRQSATSTSLSNAARQAAEFGLAEIVSEMNRDAKSYLWVTKFSEWNNVRDSDLRTCGVMSTAVDRDVGRPITGSTLPIAVSGELPNSSTASVRLSYRLTDFQAPFILPGSLPESLSSSPQRICGETGKFGNLIGGTAELTIVGTVMRPDGSPLSTYALKRMVSVKRVAPIFNNPINQIPLSRTYASGDSRFPNFPVAPIGGTYYRLNCVPKNGSVAVITCSADSDSGPLPPEDFKSGIDQIPPPPLDYFPFVRGVPWPGVCNEDGNNVRCLVESIKVDADTANPIQAFRSAKANMLVKSPPPRKQVEIFLSKDITVGMGSILSGDYWSRFRIYGVASGNCGSQKITMNPLLTPVKFVEPNLQNVFVWLPKGEIKLATTRPAVTQIQSLVGSVCKTVSFAPVTLLSHRNFFEGLGGAYDFEGVFGGQLPIRFIYRGFGGAELSISS